LSRTHSVLVGLSLLATGSAASSTDVENTDLPDHTSAALRRYFQISLRPYFVSADDTKMGTFSAPFSRMVFRSKSMTADGTLPALVMLLEAPLTFLSALVKTITYLTCGGKSLVTCCIIPFFCYILRIHYTGSYFTNDFNNKIALFFLSLNGRFHLLSNK